jgi:hypothetical protein
LFITYYQRVKSWVGMIVSFQPVIFFLVINYILLVKIKISYSTLVISHIHKASTYLLHLVLACFKLFDIEPTILLTEYILLL